MSYSPGPAVSVSVMLTPWHEWSLASELVAGGAIPASAAWPSANRAIFVPFYLPVPVTVLKLFWSNGATVNGNTDCGIYRQADSSRVVSTGSTAQAGTSVLQEVNITDTFLEPGTYYMALASSSGTATFLRAATQVTSLRLAAVQDQDTAFALPNPATLSTLATGYMPVFGLACRTLVA